MDDIRYPIGRFSFEAVAGPMQRTLWIEDIAATPLELRAAVANLSAEQLDTPYRADGWTVRQIAHHLPDSHVNAYIRIKLALTEDAPTIKPYDQAGWADLPDGRSGPIEVTLALLEALHERWVLVLRQMSPADFARSFVHPEHGRGMSLDEAVGMYAWHGRHHIAQITSLRQRKGWS